MTKTSDGKLVVLSRPTAGHEREYHRWYDETHIPEVLQVPGFVSAERFTPAPVAGARGLDDRFLAIYDIEGDVRTAVGRLQRAVSDRRIWLPECFDRNSALLAPFARR